MNTLVQGMKETTHVFEARPGLTTYRQARQEYIYFIPNPRVSFHIGQKSLVKKLVLVWWRMRICD